jgi:hypothetical protein
MKTPEEVATAAIAADTAAHLNMEIANVEDVHAIVVRAIKMDREAHRAAAYSEVPESGDYRDGTEAEDTGGF